MNNNKISKQIVRAELRSFLRLFDVSLRESIQNFGKSFCPDIPEKQLFEKVRYTAFRTLGSYINIEKKNKRGG